LTLLLDLVYVFFVFVFLFSLLENYVTKAIKFTIYSAYTIIALLLIVIGLYTYIAISNEVVIFIIINLVFILLSIISNLLVIRCFFYKKIDEEE
jgi:hypothetical protein